VNRAAAPSPTSPDPGRADNPAYAAFHAPRFAFLLDLVGETIGPTGGRVLDVGRSPFTEQLSRRRSGTVDSLGLEPDATHGGGRHYRFDLNEVHDRGRWRTDLGPYDAIVFAEVIEHLHTAPELVLAYLRHLLVPGGALLLQTPNAAALRKRIKLLAGVHPYERIRADPSNPGHFREYTAPELRSIAAEAGFAVEHLWTRYYFDARFARHDTGHEPPAHLTGTLKNLVHRLLPASLREGITLVARRRG
jgi:SAM-dependent methyltransferase